MRVRWGGPLLALVAAVMATPGAQERGAPTARLSSAARLALPGEIDSSNPMAWDIVDGLPRLFAISSWGGVPKLAEGPSLDALRQVAPVTFVVYPGHGVWFESILVDDAGSWYGFYHHEHAALECGRADRQLPRIGAARSANRGLTWEDLGVILDAAPESAACGSGNRFVLGGVGDATAVLDANRQDVYFYFTQYMRDPSVQGVAVARMAWADRDAPVGTLSIWNDGAWLPVERVSADDEEPPRFAYPAGTPLVAPGRPFHDTGTSADVFWGASIHWNTYLEQYVMVLNRAKDDHFGQDGIYVSYAPTLDSPHAWTVPVKIHNGGGWYPQVVGLEPGSGTDRLAGRRTRLFITGKSEHFIEFEK